MSYQFTEKSQSAQASILSKLNKQVAGADYKKLPEEVPFDYPFQTDEQQLSRFITLLENNHAEVISLAEEDIAKAIAAALQKRGISRLLYGTNTDYSTALEQQFNGSENAIELTPFDFNLNENKAFVFNDVPASFTSSKYAIAETGTVVLWPTKEQPRTMSLIPPLHIVAVRQSSLYPSLTKLVAEQQWHSQMPTNILLISGPSKTADIQQTLAFGAHGPKELIVLLIKD